MCLGECRIAEGAAAAVNALLPQCGVRIKDFGASTAGPALVDDAGQGPAPRRAEMTRHPFRPKWPARLSRRWYR
jgi:hypothetical protein